MISGAVYIQNHNEAAKIHASFAKVMYINIFYFYFDTTDLLQLIFYYW